MGRGCGCGGVANRYQVPKAEQPKGSSARKIKFSMWKQRDGGLTLEKKTEPIGVFMSDYYLPTLAEYDYHHTLGRVLKKCDDA